MVQKNFIQIIFFFKSFLRHEKATATKHVLAHKCTMTGKNAICDNYVEYYDMTCCTKSAKMYKDTISKQVPTGFTGSTTFNLANYFNMEVRNFLTTRL